MKTPDFWWHPDPEWKARALTPLSYIYEGARRIDQSLKKLRHNAHAPRPSTVICIGNALAGGAGKTPVAEALARVLASQGPSGILMRGYKGRLNGPLKVDPDLHTYEDVGDEALMLAQTLPRDVGVYVAGNRMAGLSLMHHQGLRFAVLDDGYQNPSISKDYHILVWDGAVGAGNGRVLPAGPLRAPLAQTLAAADIVLSYAGPFQPPPPCADRTFPLQIVPQSLPKEDQPLLAFAGIGRPQKFFDFLTEHGYSLAGAQNFPDHYAYTEKDLTALQARARQNKARLVTTQKDYVRLTADWRKEIDCVSIAAEPADEAGWKNILKKLGA